MWSPAARHINPEFFFVAPASSFQNPHHHHHGEAAAAATSTINFDQHPLMAAPNAIGVIPLLTAAPYLPSDPPSSSGMQLWQHQPGPTYLKKPSSIHNNADDSHATLLSGAATCQDCGNQAKKDCPHRRCRTCCKSRGFDCSTHVKSTWVPAARRRERQLIGSTAAASSQSTSGTKKPRLAAASQTTTTASHTSTSNTTPPRSFETTSSHQDASLKDSLPGQVQAPAVFKCVKVTAVDDGEDEYAYQAVVRIGGHVFKGFLYDQGFEGRDVFPNISELHLGNNNNNGGGGGRNGGSSSSHQNIDPSDLYAASGGGLIGGSTYGNPIN